MSSNRSTTFLIVGIILIGMNALAFAPYVSQATVNLTRIHREGPNLIPVTDDAGPVAQLVRAPGS